MTEGVHFLDARAPEGMRLYAIGDIHVRRDIIERMHGAIGEDLARDPPADWRIIHLGDYTDRGPDTKGVLDFLVAAGKRDSRVLSIAGNHDIGMLEFLDRPDIDSLFAHYGGKQTAQSYGVDIDFANRASMLKGHTELLEAIPEAHFTFLKTLPFWVAFGDYYFCHAGVRPGVALDAQDPEDLMWIRDDFHNYPGLLPKVVVHGHTPVGEAEFHANRVNVDTMAVLSGVLTAFVADGEQKRLLQVEG